MHKLHELKEKLMRELEDYSENGKFSKDDVEAIKYITSAIDHICNIVADGDGEEYSGNSYPYTYGSNMRGGRSYARRRRDAMGRYSRAGEDFKAELEGLIDDAPNERIRQKVRELMREV